MENETTLTLFALGPHCDDESYQLVKYISINLKLNLFKIIKHITPITIQRNHLTHYLPLTILERDQQNKHNIFSLTDENGKIKTFYNFNNDVILQNLLKIFLTNYEF